MIVRSNAIGIPLLAVIQGGIATLGYYLAIVPSALLFGFLTCFPHHLYLDRIGMVPASRLSCSFRRLDTCRRTTSLLWINCNKH